MQPEPVKCTKHFLNQIVVKDEQVFKETIYMNPCPFCQLEALDKYFTSGNSVTVDRATILAKDYWAIRGNETI